MFAYYIGHYEWEWMLYFMAEQLSQSSQIVAYIPLIAFAVVARVLPQKLQVGVLGVKVLVFAISFSFSTIGD